MIERIIKLEYAGRVTWRCHFSDDTIVESNHELIGMEWEALKPVDVPVDAPVTEPMAGVVQESPIEAAMKSERDRLKIEAISYIKMHPNCSREDVTALSVGSLLNGDGLIGIYVANAYQMGLITEATWEAFRALVLALTPEELMGL